MLDALRTALEVLQSDKQSPLVEASVGSEHAEEPSIAPASPGITPAGFDNMFASSRGVPGLTLDLPTRQHSAGASQAPSRPQTSPAMSIATSRPQTSPGQISMRATPRPRAAAVTAAGQGHGEPPDGPSSVPCAQLHFRHDPLQLTPSAIRSLQVPQTNLALARFLAKQHTSYPCPNAGTAVAVAAVQNFVNVMHMFYYEFVCERYAASEATAAQEEAEAALRHVEASVHLASTLVALHDIPVCSDLDAVMKVASDVADQVLLLAEHGLALPAFHVEYVRQAIDSAGAQLLSSPPLPDPGERLLWAEQAMKLQMAPLPHFANCLQAIARQHVDPTELQELAREGVKPPAAEGIRLLAAVTWVVDASCRSDPSWADSRQCCKDAEAWVEKLAKWSPVRDCTPQRLARARELLFGCWSWVSAGCGGSKTFGVLFAWASFAVVLLPMVEMAQRLIPVHRAVQKGIAKWQKVPKEQEAIAKARAWTAALFLLDNNDEPWWWLQLIKPASEMDPPWLDGEDGGLGATSAAADVAGLPDEFPVLSPAIPSFRTSPASPSFPGSPTNLDAELETTYLADPEEVESLPRQASPGSIRDGGESPSHASDIGNITAPQMDDDTPSYGQALKQYSAAVPAVEAPAQ